MSPKPGSRELAPAGTSAHSRLFVQVTSPKRASGPRRYAVVSTPTCDLNRTGCSSGITCEMVIYRQLTVYSQCFQQLFDELCGRGFVQVPEVQACDVACCSRERPSCPFLS